MPGHVFDTVETTIQSGGVDVEVEVIKETTGGVYASMVISGLTEEPDMLDELTEDDVKNLHKVTGEALTKMREARK